MSALSPVNSNDIRWSDGPNQNGRNSQADNNNIWIHNQLLLPDGGASVTRYTLYSQGCA